MSTPNLELILQAFNKFVDDWNKIGEDLKELRTALSPNVISTASTTISTEISNTSTVVDTVTTNISTTSTVIDTVISNTSTNSNVVVIDPTVNDDVWFSFENPVSGDLYPASDGWVWDDTMKFNTEKSHKSPLQTGIHQHYFINDGSKTFRKNLNNNDILISYVYLDPINPPDAIMLQWNMGDWEHRAYWGTNSFTWGTDGTMSRRRIGDLPPAGQWVRLEVPVSLVAPPGQFVVGMAFTLLNGQAWWAHTGKVAGPISTGSSSTLTSTSVSNTSGTTSNAVTSSIASKPSALKSGWNIVDHSFGPPYYCYPDVTIGKHTTLLSNFPYIYQIGGDYEGGTYTTEDGLYKWSEGSTRREIHRADVTKWPLKWEKVQNIFSPKGQLQGPRLGPDQVWWWLRTAVSPPEFWVGPGEYRGGAGGVAAGLYPLEWQGTAHAYQALMPGWKKSSSQRYKNTTQNEAESSTCFVTRFYDGMGKFASYDPVTDKAYTIIAMGVVDALNHNANGPNSEDWEHITISKINTNDDLGRKFHGINGAIMDTDGSFHARVGRKIYTLAKWAPASSTTDQSLTRSYLLWFDIDSKEQGAITMPFTLDPDFIRSDGTSQNGWPNPINNGGKPSEHSFIVSMHNKLYIAVNTYYGLGKSGTKPLWKYDPVMNTWTNLDPLPEDIGGNTMVAVPEQNAIYLIGSSALYLWPKCAVYVDGSSVTTTTDNTKMTFVETTLRSLEPQHAFHTTAVDSLGRIMGAGHTSHGQYGAGANYIWRIDPVAGTTETLYPNNGNLMGWISTDNFIRMYIPGFDWLWIQGLLIFDLKANKILASSIASSQAAAGATVENIPSLDTYIVREGTNLVGQSVFMMAPHAWCNVNDVGVTLNGIADQVDGMVLGQIIQKTSNGKLSIKVFQLPKCLGVNTTNSSGQAVTLYSGRSIGSGVCRDGWFYFLGNDWRGVTSYQHKAYRLNVSILKSTPDKGLVPDSAVEWLPDIPTASTAATVAYYDSNRDKIIVMCDKVLVLDPVALTWSDETPSNWPSTLTAQQVGYDPRTRAAYLYGGSIGGYGLTGLGNTVWKLYK